MKRPQLAHTEPVIYCNGIVAVAAWHISPAIPALTYKPSSDRTSADLWTALFVFAAAPSLFLLYTTVLYASVPSGSCSKAANSLYPSTGKSLDVVNRTSAFCRKRLTYIWLCRPIAGYGLHARGLQCFRKRSGGKNIVSVEAS